MVVCALAGGVELVKGQQNCALRGSGRQNCVGIGNRKKRPKRKKSGRTDEVISQKGKGHRGGGITTHGFAACYPTLLGRRPR
jgi:hypothetical protein